MGHYITAIITKEQFDHTVADKYDLPIFKENGYYIIALNESHSDFWAEKLSIVDDEDNEIILDCGTTHYFCKTLDLNCYAVINTDYFGGIGAQKANVYRYGKRILNLVSINKALRNLGVIADRNKDEFDTLNLSKYRHFDECFEKYWNDL